jgi:acyl-CoA reductase-like NAD-dependent aldehyde dehydrogenase
MLILRPQSPRTEGARKFLAAQKRLLINGEWVASERYFDTLDPATGEILASLPRAGISETNDAVSAARFALTHSDWATMTPAGRGALLWNIADLMEKYADELAELEVFDQGKNWCTSQQNPRTNHNPVYQSSARRKAALRIYPA